MTLKESTCRLYSIDKITENDYTFFMKKLQYCVYILLSLKDHKFYIGYSTNLHQRLTSHIQGNSLATEPRRPFILLFCEYFLSKHDAARREMYFKTTAGKRALRIMLKECLKGIL